MFTVFSIGYEKARIDLFCRTLAEAGVVRLVDVRERAWSHRIEYRKTALAAALNAVDVEYVHCKAAGNPQRAAAGASAEQCRRLYTAHLDGHPEVVEVFREALVPNSAVFCYEAHRHNCHRGVLLQRLDRVLPSLRVVDLNPTGPQLLLQSHRL